MTKVLPSNYIIGIILFTLFIVGGVAMIGEFNKKDSTFADDEKFTDFNDSFNKMNEVTTSVESLEKGLTTEPDVGAFGVLQALIQSTWRTLSLIVQSFGFMTSVFDAISTVFGVPTWVGGLITLLVTVVLVFGIWGAIFQRDL